MKQDTWYSREPAMIPDTTQPLDLLAFVRREVRSGAMSVPLLRLASSAGLAFWRPGHKDGQLR